MKVLLLCGSANQKSKTRVLVESFAAELQAKGVETMVWDLAKRPLPLMDPAHFGTALESTHPEVREFASLVEGAQALVLGTPVYHGAYSGVLKNALDHLPAPLVRGKPCALASHGGGLRGSVVACEGLRSVVRALGGLAISLQVSTGPDDYQSQEGEFSWLLTAKDVNERIRFAVDELVQLTRRLAAPERA